MTLTGVHVQRPSLWLWALRIVPVVIYVLVALGAVNLIAKGGGSREDGVERLVYGFAVYGFFIQTAVIFVTLCCGRKDMDTLERQLEKMEKLASCMSPKLHREVLSRIGVFVTLAVLSCGLWISFPLVVGDFTHGNYQIQMELPQVMQTQLGYWYCIAFQIVAVLLSSCLALAFDCCYFTWLNAISFHLKAIRYRVEALDQVQVHSSTPEDEEAPRSPLPTSAPSKIAWSVDDVREEESQDRPQTSMIGGGDVEKLYLRKVVTDLGRELDALKPVECLHIIDIHYSQVRALSEIINHLCGLPALVTHASTMTTILFGVYASMMLGSLDPYPGRDTQLTGFVVFISIFTLRIMFISFDGGKIAEQCEALAAALAGMEWLHLPPEAKQRREAILQKTSQPIAISAAGVFNINKINVLNVFSFILTYLVVMMQ